MSRSATRLKLPPPTWREYYAQHIVLGCLVLMGPAFVFYGYYADYRDRPSLQWPKVSGTVEQCEQIYHPGRYHGGGHYYNIRVSYTYVVNDRHYQGRQIALWNPDLHGNDGGRTEAFVSAHPARSTADVYYDPQHPENAVLIPGPDEAGNHDTIRLGCFIFVPLLLMALVMRKHLARMKATLQSARARSHAHGSAAVAGLPHGFASYEPGCKRKLNVFPDKDCLQEVLGQKGAPLQEWKPEDRMIDATGREYRLVKAPDKNSYDLDPTGETWSVERLLDAAEAEFRWLKKDPGALRRRLNDVPEGERMSVLLKSMDDGPAGARWVMPGFFLFLVLFALAVMFGAGAIFSWLLSRLQR